MSAFAGLGLTLDFHCCWRDGDNSNLRLVAASAISMFSLPFFMQSQIAWEPGLFATKKLILVVLAMVLGDSR